MALMASESTYREFEENWIRYKAGELTTEEWIIATRTMVSGALDNGERGFLAIDFLNQINRVAGGGVEPPSAGQ